MDVWLYYYWIDTEKLTYLAAAAEQRSRSQILLFACFIRIDCVHVQPTRMETLSLVLFQLSTFTKFFLSGLLHESGMRLFRFLADFRFFSFKVCSAELLVFV